MEQISSNEIIGRKTFLVGVDPNMFSDAYLENLLAHGYETYQIAADNVCTIEQKVEMIISLHKGAILLFYIDSPIDNTTWPKYIQELLGRHKEDAYIGILYSKRGIDAERLQLEALYRQLGVQCGCTALGYQKAQNFQIIDNLLANNHANGRRKIVRAFCNNTSEIALTVGMQRIRGRLQDISLSHFSCIIEEQPDYISLNQHFKDVQLLVNGSRYRSNAQLVMQRQMPSGLLHIFMFNKADKTPGLEEEDYFKLCPKIYHMVTDEVKERLRNTFFMMNRYRGEKAALEELVEKVLVELKITEEKKIKRDKKIGE